MTSVIGGLDMQQPDNWSELASLIDTLLDAPADRRSSLIDDLSKGDSLRRAELERLLAECENTTILNRPAADLFSAMFNDDITQFPPALVDRYRVNPDLGGGGMATVFHARDLKHGRDVAVKVVHPHLASALGTDRFLHEIEIVSQLHHPHIVPLYDSGNSDGFLYYVMPYEPGLSLRQRLARHGPLPPKEVVLILRDVCDALSYAHEHGIVHRDIKPDNVLMSGRHAMVTDFGVAKAATDAAVVVNGAGRLPVGTPAYMAPEQIEPNRDIDHRADIYAVGVLGYELLAGRPPFTGYTRDEILSRQLMETPPPLSTFRPDVPDELARLLTKSMEKQPADRWQTADEFLHHLETLEMGQTVARPMPPSRGRRLVWVSALAAVAVLVADATVMSRRSTAPPTPAPLPIATRWAKRFSAARIERLTDFPGSEVDASISASGDFVAFLADRHNVFDAFVTQLGSEQLLNLTGGRYPRLLNQSVRSIGFSSDGAHVWIRDGDVASPKSLSLLALPGGRPRPFLSKAVMAAWSPDGSRVAYQESAPGDPIFVGDGEGRNPRRVFVSEPGVHNHYLSWSPDGRFIYFAHGLPPEQMDVWRVPSNGGNPEPITSHALFAAYPVALDTHTLVYTAAAEDGTGPWLYLLDIDTRVPRRVSGGIDHYASVAASGEVPTDGRRLVSTISSPRVELWSVAIDGVPDFNKPTRAPQTPEQSSTPRFGPRGSLAYLASSDGANSLWQRAGTSVIAIWPAARGAVVGPAAISPDGTKICFVVHGRTGGALHCTVADGSGDSIVASSLEPSGAPSWSPDGKWIAIAAKAAGDKEDVAHVYKVPVGGGAPTRLVDSVSSNPVWSPNGRLIAYCGPSLEGSAPVRAVTPGGKTYPLPPLSVDCVGDSYRFSPDGKALVVKLGEMQHQDFWRFDLTSGVRQRLTRLPAGQSIRHFDVTADGKRIVFDRTWENSDIVLIDLPRR